MNIIFIMIAVSLLLAIIFFLIFIKLVKNGQYDDVYTPSVRMLFDDELVDNKKEPKSINK